jgi:hypothetical protein
MAPRDRSNVQLKGCATWKKAGTGWTRLAGVFVERVAKLLCRWLDHAAKRGAPSSGLLARCVDRRPPMAEFCMCLKRSREASLLK